LNGDIIASWPLSTMQTAETLEIIGRYGLTAELHVDDSVCVENKEKFIKKYIEYKLSHREDKSIQELLEQEVNGRDYEDVGLFSTFIQDQKRIIKKIFIMENNMQIINDFIREASKIPGLEITQSNVNNIEITNEQASKGKALAMVADHLGIHSSEVVAVGDGLNDISMFEYAGFSVAMGNAISTVKERASKVTLSHDEDGLVYAIENLILRKE
jgi:Cof subfamily protein (haloacid dehalogenase superfamily)